MLFFSQQLFKMYLVGKISSLPLDENSHGLIAFWSVLYNKKSYSVITIQSQRSYQKYLVLELIKIQNLVWS